MIRSPRITATVLVVCLLFGVACSSDGEAGDEPGQVEETTTTTVSGASGDNDGSTTTEATSDPDPVPEPTGSPDRSIRGMLQLVADTDENAELVLVSLYGAAEEAVDLSSEGQPGDEDYELDRLLALTVRPETGITLHPPEVAGGQRVAQVLGALGFWPSDIGAEIQVGQPPAVTHVAVGDFDSADVLDRAATIDGATRTDVDGTEVVRWLDDRATDLMLESPIGQISGQAGRVALPADRTLVHTTADAEMEAAIDTIGGDGASLADRTDLGAVATALDEEGVMGAYLSASAGRQPSAPANPAGEAQQGEEGLVPYSAYGVGGGLEDGSPLLVIVLSHDSSEDAEANGDRLATRVAEGRDPASGRPWSAALTDADIEVRGNVLVARFATENPSLWTALGTGSSQLLRVG